MEIIKDKAIDAWKEALKFILNNGSDFIDPDKRVCREFINLSITINNPKTANEPIKKMYKFNDLIYPQTEELEDSILNNNPLYHYSYSNRIFKYKNAFNQINEFIIPLLKRNPTSRRAIVMIYDPMLDSQLNHSGSGLLFIQFKIQDNKLTIIASIRSNDLFIGWPANLYQLYVLQRYVAKKLEIEPGKIITISISAHIFHENIEKIKTII